MTKNFKILISLLILNLFLSVSYAATKKTEVPFVKNLRAPAYPLVTIDPYTSAWSEADRLYDDVVRHWTGKRHGLIGALRVDGQTYRFLGKEEITRETLLPMANQAAWSCRYQLKEPDAGWENPRYDDSAWMAGKGALGTAGTPDLATQWNTKDIWIRREFTLSTALAEEPVFLIYSHDDIFTLFLNGHKIVDTGYAYKFNRILPLSGELRKYLIPGGKNVIAVHCQNTKWAGYVDFGLYQDRKIAEVFSQAAVQKSAGVSATQTRYEFTCGGIDLDLTFMSPLLPQNLDVLSRPVSYVGYEVKSNDGKRHDVQIYFEATPEWAVDQPAQEVSIKKGQSGGLTWFKAGTTKQSILGSIGDDKRIDWGYFYLCGNNSADMSYASGDYESIKKEFATSGFVQTHGGESLGNTSAHQPISPSGYYKMMDKMPVMACAQQFNQVSSNGQAGKIMIGYDDLCSIQYFGENRMAWWKKDGKVSIEDVLKSASAEFEGLKKQCGKFDTQLWADALNAGGEKYAEICVLAFRQAIAAHKLIGDKEGNTIFLSKENFSNGSIGTVDVTYPSAPLFLIYNPELLKGMMNPIFYYSESGRWAKPFAAHDVGTYPKANGQTYGADMPVEECGNMLILSAAIAQAEGKADYALKHWEILSLWVDYLLKNGLDPENQLCTDDFAGHFAHNTNLSVKAIMGIACYAKLAGMLGRADVCQKYSSKAKEMAGKWVEMANNGDHFKLTFDQNGTWSQKYNLVWDKLLGLNIFDPAVAKKEIAYYLTKQNTYGLPLDNRKTYSKSDWIIWTATLASDQSTFEKFIGPLYRFVNETPSRVPMNDWFQTTDATKVGFQARSVVGGYYIKILEQKFKTK